MALTLSPCCVATPFKKLLESGCCFAGAIRGRRHQATRSIPKYSVMNKKTSCFQDFHKLGRVLGHGSFGVVHVAQDSQCQRTCVVKIVDTTVEEDCQGLDSEIKIHSVLDHPNIVRLYETFQDQSELRIIMEICHGGELADYARRQSDPFSEQEARHIFGQVVTAVRYMHCQRFAHRDIKMENFLVKEEGLGLSECTIKLIDFGFTTPFIPGRRSLKTKIGTPVYMAPEIFHQSAYDERCDLWSCGILLYVLLSRRWPFHSDNLDELQELLRMPITFPEKPWRGRSRRVRSLVSRICRRRAGDRLTALEILQSDWLRAAEDDRLSRTGVLTVDMLSNARDMENMTAFQRESFLRVAYYSEESQIAALRDVFLQLDTDADGKLTWEELSRGLDTSIAKPSDLPSHLFQDVDLEGTCVLGYTEFVAEFMDKAISPHTCRAAFRSLDKDMDGTISVSDLQIAFQEDGGSRRGSDLAFKALGELLEEFDTNHDGEIDFCEFTAMLNFATPQIHVAAVHGGA